jgi:hypothetical protein
MSIQVRAPHRVFHHITMIGKVDLAVTIVVFSHMMFYTRYINLTSLLTSTAGKSCDRYSATEHITCPIQRVTATFDSILLNETLNQPFCK